MSESEKGKKVKSKVKFIFCAWGVFCSLSSTDVDKKNISLFNIIEQINVPQGFLDKQKKDGRVYVYPIPHQIILFWRRLMDLEISDKAITGDLRFRTIGPNGKILQETITPFNLQSGFKNLRFKMERQGIITDRPGGYNEVIDIKYSGDKEFEHAYDIPYEVVVR